MTLFFFCLVVFSEACSVTGQIFFKHAMSDQSTSTRTRRRLDLAGGVLAMTVGFFIWLALLRRFDLSYLYPFEGVEQSAPGCCGVADSKGENDAGSLGRGDLNLYWNRVCRRKLISNLPSFERLSNRSRLRN